MSHAFCSPWTAACQNTLSSAVSQSLLKVMSFESVMLSNHLILCHPLLLLPSIFPSMRIFLMSWLLVSGGQSIRASAAVLPMNIQGWFPLGLIDLISLQSKRLSRVFSSTTFKSINSAVLSLLYGPSLTSVHDYWKNHSFDYKNFFLAKWCLCFLIYCLGLSQLVFQGASIF